MKRIWLRAAGLAACMMMLTAGALAQDAMQIYVGDGALEEGTAGRLMMLLEREFPQAEFEWTPDGASLRELVLSDHAPQLAICSPGEVLPWAEEGLMLPLQKRIDDQEEIAQEVLSVCVHEENLFMAPLMAHHRQMAVNVKMLEKRGMGYMLDEVAHAVWYPTEFQQMLEEFAIADLPALDVWTTQESAPIEALIQAIYCGGLLGDDGETCKAESKAVLAGVRWLRDLVDGELIGRQESRKAALDRFLAGETVIFLDWTKEMQKKYAQRMKGAGMEIVTKPYPSSSGLPVRSYEVTGVSVLDSGDARKNALALEAAVFLHEDAQAQAVLDERMIFEDGSIWLWDLAASGRGATLRSLLHDALERILDGEAEIDQALSVVKAGMDAAQ